MSSKKKNEALANYKKWFKKSTIKKSFKYIDEYIDALTRWITVSEEYLKFAYERDNGEDIRNIRILVNTMIKDANELGFTIWRDQFTSKLTGITYNPLDRKDNK